MNKHLRKSSEKKLFKSEIWASFKLVALVPETHLKKIRKKRDALRSQISEQILMATDRSYSPIKYKWLTESDGHIRKVAIPKNLKKCWREIPKGKLQVCIYVSGKVLELEAGKSAIEIESYYELVPTLKLIQKAVDLGDFDALIL